MLFGGGGRLCPGKDLGMAEIATFLHYFVTKYRFVHAQLIWCSLKMQLGNINLIIHRFHVVADGKKLEGIQY